MTTMENPEDFLKTIEDELTKGLKEKRHPKRSLSTSSSNQQSEDLRIKFEFNGEKRLIHMPRPVTYVDLVNKIKQYYGLELNIIYTQPNGEIRIPIQNQGGLENAIQLLDQNYRLSSLRLLLTKAVEEQDAITGSSGSFSSGSPSDLRYDAVSSWRGERDSPPPGVLPHGAFHSQGTFAVEGDGIFIPEDHAADLGSRSGSQTSMDSSYQSQDNSFPLRGDTYPMRGKCNSIRSIYSDSNIEAYGERGKGGTYPVRVKHSSHAQGCRTFPRTQRLDMTMMSVHSNYSCPPYLESERSISTSSSSSGLAADYDSPDARMRRGTGDFKASNSLMGLQSAKSPRAPSNWKRGKVLGSGAFGQVYLCYDTDTGRELAVKQVSLSNENEEISKEVRALECEIKLLRNLQHSRIVQYFGCYQDDSFLCIFMEYMPGGSVKDELRNYGALTENVTRKYTRQVLEGLEYLHDHMIVHRDIKGANILKDPSGNVKLGDFGASRRLQAICSQTLMQMSVSGTPYWMSPEVINGEGYGRRADIWSLGCTVVEMFTTTPPWGDLEAMAAIFKIATMPQPRYELPRSASNAAVDFLKKTFIKIPQDRPGAKDLLRHPFISDV
ncbi:mitogen-activated protein kinase kinase kinase 3-like [Liolophura sinensis]|uniref:mitogen-activated protein kinase kinase kinase 3-like n=1 Tax=Liolophura sinensis TaxID=3198878 RepID=UPI0031581784